MLLQSISFVLRFTLVALFGFYGETAFWPDCWYGLVRVILSFSRCLHRPPHLKWAIGWIEVSPENWMRTQRPSRSEMLLDKLFSWTLFEIKKPETKRETLSIASKDAAPGPQVPFWLPLQLNSCVLRFTLVAVFGFYAEIAFWLDSRYGWLRAN